MDTAVLGIDVSKKKFDVALLINTKFLAKSYPNSKSGFEALCEWLKGREISPHICMESTGIYGKPSSHQRFWKE